MVIQNQDKTRADVTVGVEVMPGLQAEFDAIKISRLLALINVVVLTINEALDPTDEQELTMIKQLRDQSSGAGAGDDCSIIHGLLSHRWKEITVVTSHSCTLVIILVSILNTRLTHLSLQTCLPSSPVPLPCPCPY